MKMRLKELLKKSSRFKRKFVKYLKSLDYGEFIDLYVYYSIPLARLMNKYQNRKIKFLSIEWFKYKILSYKYTNIFTLFWDGNKNYIIKYNKQTEELNNKVVGIINSIKEKSDIIQNISKNTYYLGSSYEENIKFFIAMVDNIYSYNELIKLYEELDNLKKVQR